MLALALPLMLAACGGSSPGGNGGGAGENARQPRVTPQAQVRAIAAQYQQLIADGENALACELTTNQKKCLGFLAQAVLFLGPKSLKKMARDMRIVSVRVAPDGRSARVRWSRGDKHGD